MNEENFDNLNIIRSKPKHYKEYIKWLQSLNISRITQLYSSNLLAIDSVPSEVHFTDRDYMGSRQD